MFVEFQNRNFSKYVYSFSMRYFFRSSSLIMMRIRTLESEILLLGSELRIGTAGDFSKFSYVCFEGAYGV